MSAFLDSLEAELSVLRTADRFRSCPEMAGSDRIHFRRDNHSFLAFASNDYLGLASHPALTQAAGTAAATIGFGAGAARLVSGDLPPHRQLEAALSEFLGLPDCLLFSTGYHANLAVITSLAGPDDLIVSDQANHASLIDGCRLSRATTKIAAHADVAAFRTALQTPGTFRRRLLVTESLFSMDGDIAPLRQLATAARDTGAVLIVDEAHALGALGPDGRGLCAANEVTPDVLIGTMGKAFGSFGGFVAGQPPLRQFLVNRARTFIFTTSLPPSISAAGVAAVNLVSGAEGARRRAALQANCGALAQQLEHIGAFPAAKAAGPIFPVIVGQDRRALAAAQILQQRGLFVPAIRPPTVPEGTARLRVTVSADHQPADIAALVSALADLPS